MLVFISCGRTKKSIPKSLKNLKNLTVLSKNAKPEYEITLTKDATYGDSKEAVLGPLIKDIAVDDRGRVYIADFFAKKIRVYNPDGSFLQSFGRKGRGPGEFQMIWVLRVHDNQLFALDYMQSRVSVFNLNTLKYKKDMSLSIDKESNKRPSWINWTRKKNLHYRPINFYIRSDGDFLVFFGDEDTGYSGNIKGRTYEGSIFDPKLNTYLTHDVFSFKWTGKMLTYKGTDGEVMLGKVPYKLSSQFDFSGDELVYG